ncbi:MAG: hypothetical protein KME17_21350 [Cyanosarcina radialis HA8281-LM2]|jgi:Mg2+ and Co2+ transporter CorA|nr:hypothetical protein [Cyanosarcina radialis HA8281-LM2]
MPAKGKSDKKTKQQTANGSETKANKSENGSAKKSDKSQSKAEKSSAEKSTDKIPSIKSLTKTLEGDLTTADPEAALQQIEEWEAALKASDDKEIKAIAKEFKKLTKMVKDEASEAEFADLFVELGERVNEAADSADEEIQEQLQEIGDALLGAADYLDTIEEEYIDEEEEIEEEAE